MQTQLFRSFMFFDERQYEKIVPRGPIHPLPLPVSNVFQLTQLTDHFREQSIAQFAEALDKRLAKPLLGW